MIRKVQSEAFEFDGPDGEKETFIFSRPAFVDVSRVRAEIGSATRAMRNTELGKRLVEVAENGAEFEEDGIPDEDFGVFARYDTAGLEATIDCISGYRVAGNDVDLGGADGLRDALRHDADRYKDALKRLRDAIYMGKPLGSDEPGR